MELDKLLQLMLEKKASDLHVRSNTVPYIRIDGVLIALDIPPLSSSEVEVIANELMDENQKEIFSAKRECDLSRIIPGSGRFRINIFQQRGVLNFAVRHIPLDIPSIDELNLPAVLKKVADNQRGLILVAGPTGSGKSTTLAAIIDYINSTRPCHIVTVEDPIEFVHTDKKSIISQREIGSDTASYHDALKHIVRQDPDVILIGEMRDLETMAVGLTAAQLGHLVLSTIHTIDAIQTVTRVVDLFPPHQQNQIRFQLADALKGVISQRLVISASGKGMVPAVEILIATQLVQKYIQENSLSEISALMKQGQFYGMQTFNQSLLKLFQEGKIKLEHALMAATSPEELMLAIKGIETSAESSNMQMLERFDTKK